MKPAGERSAKDFILRYGFRMNDLRCCECTLAAVVLVEAVLNKYNEVVSFSVSFSIFHSYW